MHTHLKPVSSGSCAAPTVPRKVAAKQHSSHTGSKPCRILMCGMYRHVKNTLAVQSVRLNLLCKAQAAKLLSGRGTLLVGVDDSCCASRLFAKLVHQQV
jgi:hypothetical protein